MSQKKKSKEDKTSPFYALKEMRDRLEKEAAAKADAKSGTGKTAGAAAKQSPQKQAKPSKANAGAHDDEVASFHRLMSGVEPLPRDKPGRAGDDVNKNVRAGQVAAIAKTETEEARERLAELATGGLRFEVTDDGKHMEGRRTDTPPELLRKLRRGLLPVDAKLDLHEHRAEEAERALFAFLGRARSNKERVVLVIHGRGQHSPGGTGVLRGEIGAWLSQGRANRYVAAFATARADDGGEGAVYVALAR